MSDEIEGLREALVQQARERERREAVAVRLEDAYQRLTSVTAKRHDAKGRAAMGETVKLAPIEAAVSEAEDLVSTLSDLLAKADAGVEEAEKNLQSVLWREFDRREHVAQERKAEAEAAFLRAAKEKSEAANALMQIQGFRSRATHPWGQSSDITTYFRRAIQDLAPHAELSP